MMANNWQRLNIWLKLQDKTSYAEYKIACEAAGAAPHGAHEFAQKVGMVMCGMTANPELPVAEAYLKFIQDNQEAFTPPMIDTSRSVVPQPGMAGIPQGYKKESVTITFSDGRTEEREIITIDPTAQSSSTGCCGGGQVK